MLPVFAACDGADVVAVCSGHLENAQSTAKEFSIPGAYDDFESMIEQENLDLLLITTPPYLHLAMSKAALEKRLHVLCEKPTAMNLVEATEMYALANESGLLHLIDHELRFNPAFIKMKQLVADGYLGSLESVSFEISGQYPFNPDRRWNWWSDESKGGGLLGALGSHQIDLVRYILGEISEVKGQIRTFAKTRKLPQSDEERLVTSDDYASFLARLESGAIGTITLDSTARTADSSVSWSMAFHGKSGSLSWEVGGKLLGMGHSTEVEDLTPDRKTTDIDGLPSGIFPESFAIFGPRIIDALLEGRTEVQGAATFYDGMRVQAVIDAVRKSDREGGWTSCQAS